MTYKLWDSNGRITINNQVCTLQAQSLTGYGKARARSARGSTLCKHKHLQTNMEKKKSNHEINSQLSDVIIYKPSGDAEATRESLNNFVIMRYKDILSDVGTGHIIFSDVLRPK